MPDREREIQLLLLGACIASRTALKGVKAEWFQGVMGEVIQAMQAAEQGKPVKELSEWVGGTFVAKVNGGVLASLTEQAKKDWVNRRVKRVSAKLASASRMGVYSAEQVAKLQTELAELLKEIGS